MKRITKYLLWIPFAVSIGAFILYLRYIIMFKLNSNLVITDQVSNVLNNYLIVAFISLFIGLFIILFKKVMNLVHNNVTIIKNTDNLDQELDQEFIDSVQNDYVKGELEEESNFMKEFKNKDLIKVKLADNKDNIENKKVCPKCNNILDEDAIICTNCGILLDKNILNVISKNYNVEPKKKFSILNLIVNIVVIILCIFLIFLIGNKIINKTNQNYNNMNIEINQSNK